MTYRTGVEIIDGDGEHVVARDDTSLRKSFFAADFDFRPDPANRSGDRGAGHGGEHSDRSITSENAHRSSSSRLAKVRPKNVVPSYHAGAVFAANRRADWTSAASGGWRL
jgi:hypothetical protein